MNAFSAFVEANARAYRDAEALRPAERVEPLPIPAADAPTAVIFSPHPDDECIVGGLPLRLRRESGWRVINVAVTLGSLQSRRAERMAELEEACARLGFELVPAGDGGLEAVRLETRRNRPHHWTHAVNAVGTVLLEHRPAAVFLPHAVDGNPTHMGVHALVRHALHRTGAGLRCLAVETEFWSPMEDPNCLVESSADDVARLVEALACHRGEVSRNPYHLRLPAWLMDNVRRVGERLGGAGSRPPDFLFGTPYGIRLWTDRRLREPLPEGAFVSAGEAPGPLLERLLGTA
ncbi:MAG: PIG-L family deacetylase [Opitutales bacterium]|nr:PIG-L family deacetylase [Opitutales bacterium]